MNIQSLSRETMLRQIAADLGLRDSQSPEFLCAVVSESLRAYCGLRESPEGVSTVQMCRYVQRTIEPIFPSVAGTTAIADELERLDELGDVVRVGHRALVGPARRIEIDGLSSLLLGGGSAWQLPHPIRKSLLISGRCRVSNGQCRTEDFARLPFQRLEDWLQLDDSDMETWAKNFMIANVKNQRNVEIPDSLAIWRRHKWTPLDEAGFPRDVYLARRTVHLFGNPTSEYRLLRAKWTVGEAPRIEASVEVTKDIARKLQGWMRSAESGPERISYTLMRDGIVEVLIKHPLPKGFSKLLLLGWEITPASTGSPWPKKFEFNVCLLPILRKAFHLLGYEFIEKLGRVS